MDEWKNNASMCKGTDTLLTFYTDNRYASHLKSAEMSDIWTIPVASNCAQLTRDLTSERAIVLMCTSCRHACHASPQRAAIELDFEPF